MKKLFLLTTTLFISMSFFSQSELWKPINKVKTTSVDYYTLETTSDFYFSFELEAFQSMVNRESSGFIIPIPIDSKNYVDFKLSVNTTMSEGLMSKFPTIRSFNGWALDGSSRRAKVEISENYFRAMILTPGKEDLFIDPVIYSHSPQSQYVLYKKNELIVDKEFSCKVETLLGSELDKEIPVSFEEEKGFNTCELRTYEIAIAATGEYTNFHGGTVPNALAAIATTLNRINGLYERDFGITMTLIPNNDEIIYTDPQNDPYTNNNTMQLFMENQLNLMEVIGEENFDVGHVFATGSGGVAMFKSVCSVGSKAKAATGLYSPIGDPFDVDYVSHEIGHQFGGNHSFNVSCQGNVNQQTGMEPGGGSTIMAYAGVCSPNIQNNSDALFHAVSLKDIGNYLSSYQGSMCADITPLGNTAPVITGYTQTLNIPKSTPFKLEMTATDSDNDELTYTFEQMNREASPQPPEATSTVGPNFRALLPTTDNFRYFPSVQNQLNSTFTWERLPSVARTMKFAATVRDNGENGGCPQSVNIDINVDGNSGPFLVTHPNTTGIIWTGNTEEEVTWDVANTTASPVNCQNVKILISTDSNHTFEVLAENVPNTGQATITVPNVNTSTALIMVISENETFFDVSDKYY